MIKVQEDSKLGILLSKVRISNYRSIESLSLELGFDPRDPVGCPIVAGAVDYEGFHCFILHLRALTYPAPICESSSLISPKFPGLLSVPPAA